MVEQQVIQQRGLVATRQAHLLMLLLALMGKEFCHFVLLWWLILLEWNTFASARPGLLGSGPLREWV